MTIRRKDTLDRLTEKIDFSEGGCWLWTGALQHGTNYRYARFGVAGKNLRAHRVLYELVVEKIEDGLVVDHLCRNPSCVNPDHLEPVVHAENIRRGDLWQYNTTHCPSGHPYVEENIYRPPGKNERCCKICREKAWRDYYAREMGRST